MPVKSKIKALLTISLFAGSVLFSAVVFASSATYVYDELDRLKEVNYADGARIIYDYDELGNRLHTYTTPRAKFTVNPVTSLTFQFADSSKGDPTSWVWDFGDGSPTSTLQNPTYTYSSAGTFTVTLTTSNSLGSNSTSNSVVTQVNPADCHARIAGKGIYMTLQAAYNAAASGDTIQVQALTFTENLAANRDITVTLAGGYLPDYSASTGASSLQGILTTSSGTLILSDFVLHQ